MTSQSRPSRHRGDGHGSRVRSGTGVGPGDGPAGRGATAAGGGVGPGGGVGLGGGLPPGLVQRVQRRLAATGAAGGDAGLRAAVADALGEDGVRLSEPGLAAVVRTIGDELTGLGPLAPLLADPLVTDVMVNGPTEVWVERAGTMERAAVRYASAAAVAGLVQRVVARLGGGGEESSRAESGSTRCCRPSPPTVRWSPSAASPGGGSSSAT